MSTFVLAVLRLAVTMFTNWSAAPLVGAVVYAAIAGHFPIAAISNRLWADMTDGKSDNQNGRTGPRPSAWHAALVGILERGLYVMALNGGRPEFIGIWLGMKTATGWEKWTEGQKIYGVSARELANAFLIGNAMSIAFAFGTWRALVTWRAGDIPHSAALLVGLVLGGYFVLWSIPVLIRWTRRAADKRAERRRQ